VNRSNESPTFFSGVRDLKKQNMAFPSPDKKVTPQEDPAPPSLLGFALVIAVVVFIGWSIF
jgi:hypothetical protein